MKRIRANGGMTEVEAKREVNRSRRSHRRPAPATEAERDRIEAAKVKRARRAERNIRNARRMGL